MQVLLAATPVSRQLVPPIVLEAIATCDSVKRR